MRWSRSSSALASSRPHWVSLAGSTRPYTHPASSHATKPGSTRSGPGRPIVRSGQTGWRPILACSALVEQSMWRWSARPKADRQVIAVQAGLYFMDDDMATSVGVDPSQSQARLGHALSLVWLTPLLTRFAGQRSSLAALYFRVSLGALEGCDFMASHSIRAVQAICVLALVGHNYGSAARRGHVYIYRTLTLAAVRVRQRVGQAQRPSSVRSPDSPNALAAPARAGEGAH